MHKSIEQMLQNLQTQNTSTIEPWSAKGSPKGLRLFGNAKFLVWRGPHEQLKIGPFGHKTIHRWFRPAVGPKAQRFVQYVLGVCDRLQRSSIMELPKGPACHKRCLTPCICILFASIDGRIIWNYPPRKFCHAAPPPCICTLRQPELMTFSRCTEIQ